MPSKKSYTKLLLANLFFLGFAGLSLIASLAVQADRLESDSYVIQFGNFNMTAGEKDSSSYHLTDTVGQTAPGPYDSASYFVGGGFQYIYQIGTFRFSIDDVDIDLGTLTPDAHNTATNQLTISTRGAGGYSIYAYELRPLTHANNTNTIADTTCDASDCDETTASVWSNQSVGGFGFNASGDDVASDFVDSSYFRQFADDSNSEDMQVISSSSNIAKNTTATITYKAGLSGIEAAGKYQTGIVYVAVPGY